MPMFRVNLNMSAPLPARVSNAPPKPLLIWDGECHFCRRWIERWRVLIGTEVEYAPYQEMAEHFPEIPREQFQRSVVYIDKKGQVFLAAAAVYRSLRRCRSKKWLWWRGGFFRSAHRPCRTSDFGRIAFRFLPLARCGRAKFS